MLLYFLKELKLSRNNTYTNPIFPLGGSEFVLSARFSLPYSLWNGVDYANLGNMEAYQDEDGNPDQAKIDQEKYKWLEFYKIKFKGTWYTRLVEKLVLRTHTEFGFLVKISALLRELLKEKNYKMF